MLRSSNGTLIQHRMNVKGCRQKIKETGFKMDDDFFSFTPKEDQIIRENWAKFVKFKKFEGTIFEFLGFDKHGLVVTNNPNLVPLAVFRHIWPILCDGLDNRFASLVRLRISYIFHPYYKENDDYDLDEVDKRCDNQETILEISEALKIPPRYLEQRKHRKKAKIPQGELVEGYQRILVLRLLYESLIDNGENKFGPNNIDWAVFRKKCRKNSIVPPEARVVNETYRKVFERAEKEIFRHLDPAPPLKNKLVYIHESYLRFAKNPTPCRRKKDCPVIKLATLFTVVFEDYNKQVEWNPPPALDYYKCQVDLKKVRERVEEVREKRKRLNVAPRAKFSVIVKKILKLEDLDGSVSQTTDVAEISSIHGDSSANSIFDGSENPDEVQTDFEISTINNTSSFINRDETILAAGGRRDLEENDTLPSINYQASKREEETVPLDLSQDIWSQLVNS
uniref:ARID domain-containing protein n=2 Tax=Caenorhabditis tropicalis TaxID=1561998 RepID=A0A1I7UWM1_9PELO